MYCDIYQGIATPKVWGVHIRFSVDFRMKTNNTEPLKYIIQGGVEKTG